MRKTPTSPLRPCRGVDFSCITEVGRDPTTLHRTKTRKVSPGRGQLGGLTLEFGTGKLCPIQTDFDLSDVSCSLRIFRVSKNGTVQNGRPQGPLWSRDPRMSFGRGPTDIHEKHTVV